MTFRQGQIDREKVKVPTIHFTARALQEVKLILANDPIARGKFLRVAITGKGCSGFTYSVGFDSKRDDDFFIPVASDQEDITLALDPFSAHYLQEATVDFLQDFEQDVEGFIVNNHQQEDYAGKFWRKDPDLTPPMKD